MKTISFQARFKDYVHVTFSHNEESRVWTAEVRKLYPISLDVTPEFNDLSSCISYIKDNLFTHYWASAPHCLNIISNEAWGPHLRELMQDRPIDELEEMFTRACTAPTTDRQSANLLLEYIAGKYPASKEDRSYIGISVHEA